MLAAYSLKSLYCLHYQVRLQYGLRAAWGSRGLTCAAR